MMNISQFVCINPEIVSLKYSQVKNCYCSFVFVNLILKHQTINKQI